MPRRPNHNSDRGSDVKFNLDRLPHMNAGEAAMETRARTDSLPAGPLAGRALSVLRPKLDLCFLVRRVVA